MKNINFPNILRLNRLFKPFSILCFSLFILFIASFFSLKVGVFEFPSEQLWFLLTDPINTNEALILYEVRIPRMLMTILVGMNMAVAGALVQLLTQNPLASPGILGINSGASLFVVAAIVFFPDINGLSLAASGFLGGLLAASIIFLIGTAFTGSTMIVKIALIGVVVQSLFAAVTQSLLIFNDESIQQILVWLTGTMAGVVWNDFFILAPISVIAFIAAQLNMKSLIVLSLGDEMAINLGQRIRLQKLITVCLVVLSAGTSVAFTGPIGFIGLITPHIVRYYTKISHWSYLPLTAVTGAALLMIADVGSRYISFPSETPVGIVTAVIGAPYFIYLARTIKR